MNDISDTGKLKRTIQALGATIGRLEVEATSSAVELEAVMQQRDAAVSLNEMQTQEIEALYDDLDQREKKIEELERTIDAQGIEIFKLKSQHQTLGMLCTESVLPELPTLKAGEFPSDKYLAHPSIRG